MAGLAIHAMQVEMLLEPGHTQEFLQRGFFHQRDLAKTHVLIHEREDLLGVVVGKTEAATDLLRHSHAYLDVPIEANAVRGDTKCGRLPHIVQECSPG